MLNSSFTDAISYWPRRVLTWGPFIWSCSFHKARACQHISERLCWGAFWKLNSLRAGDTYLRQCLRHHWLKSWFVCSVPSHFLNQRWFILNCTHGNNLPWNFSQNTIFFFRENAFENVVYNMPTICSGHNALNGFRITLCFAISHHIKWEFFHRPWGRAMWCLSEFSIWFMFCCCYCSAVCNVMIYLASL